MYQIKVISDGGFFGSSSSSSFEADWLEKNGCRLETLSEDVEKLNKLNIICITQKMEMDFTLSPQGVIDKFKVFIETSFVLEKNSLKKKLAFSILEGRSSLFTEGDFYFTFAEKHPSEKNRMNLLFLHSNVEEKELCTRFRFFSFVIPNRSL